MTEVVGTTDFEEWFDGLNRQDTKAVAAVVDALEIFGVRLRHPYSSEVRGSRYALRELRVHQGRSPLRVFYIFDPTRRAVLLVGGSKGGAAGKRFYERMIVRAERTYEAFLRSD